MTLRMDYGAVAPDAAPAMYATNGYLDDSPLDQGLRRLVELRVSQINGCNYCIWLHAQQARDLGESEDRIQAVADWRALQAHRSAQAAGRGGIFQDYRLRVASVIRDYGLNDRDQAPADSRSVHDT